MFTVSATELGTSEERWLAADSPLSLLPTLEVRPPETAVVVSPHPDDDVLAVGGLLQRLARSGTHLTVVAVTDGEASHRRSSTVKAPIIAARRRAEAAQAWAALGLDPDVVRLRAPDGAVASREEAVGEALSCCCRPGGWLIAPWHRDGHPDHDATGRAAAVAAVRSANRLVTYPVWMWHWAAPGDDRVPWGAARRFDLDPGEARSKARALSCFATQTRALRPGESPVLPEPILARFRRPYEVVIT